MWTLLIVAVMAWFAYAHLRKKKHEAEARKWSVDHKDNPAHDSRRLRWKDKS